MENEKVDPSSRRYAITITSHARRRWVERIAAPEKFRHLSQCKTFACEECQRKNNELFTIIGNSKRNIDGEIARRIRDARTAGQFVKDVNFMAAVKKRYGEARDFTFLQDDCAVFVIVKPPEESSPVLLTVMSLDMIDGTVFQTFRTKEELVKVFSRWRYERRVTAYTEDIKAVGPGFQ